MPPKQEQDAASSPSLASGSSITQSKDFNWACTDCTPTRYFATTGKVQSHKRRQHIESTNVSVEDKIYRVWRKDGVFTCPLCLHASPFPAYLRDHLNTDRRGGCDLDMHWATLPSLPDNWELIQKGSLPGARPVVRTALPMSIKEEPAAKRPKPTPTKAKPRPLASSYASSSSLALPPSSSPSRRPARGSLLAPSSSSVSAGSSSFGAGSFVFTLPPNAADLSSADLLQAQAHINALNKLFREASALPPEAAAPPPQDAAETGAEQESGPTSSSWLNPKSWF